MMCGSNGGTAAQLLLVHVAVYLSPLPLVGDAPDGMVQLAGTLFELAAQLHASAFALLNFTV
jgi:hypothetical protein